MPTFLVDECVSLQTARFIESLGLSVGSVYDLGRSGVSDSEIFKIAQDEKFVLVTYDRGFGDVRIYPPHSHNGIIILRVYDSKSLQKCHEVLKKLLKEESEFKGTLFVVDESKYRKRK